jgi:hypothetical protein
MGDRSTYGRSRDGSNYSTFGRTLNQFIGAELRVHTTGFSGFDTCLAKF